MGSEKSATQAGTVEVAMGVDNKSTGVGVGVRGCRGITDGVSVHISVGGLAGGGVERSLPSPQARAVKAMIPKKKKGFANFISVFPTDSYTALGHKLRFF